MTYYRWTAAAAVIVIAAGYPVMTSAQDASEPGAGGGNDIIVTARRVEERLQDVPISITVFNQEQISNRNVITATDLASYTPSLSVNQRWGPEKASFAIRGFIQEANTPPSVGVYFADVVTPRSYGGTTSGSNAPVGSFMDLQNVQVLKGPQGTLFGRNTTGGAVLLVPQKPTDRLEGNIEGSVGDFDMWRLQGVINAPLAETFKVRLALDRNSRQGYMRNRSGIGPKDYNDVNYFAARLGILAELTPDLENYTIATYSNSFAHGYAVRLIACNSTPPLTGGVPFTALPACDQIARQATRGDGPFDVDVANRDAFTKLRAWGVYNTTTWTVSDTLTIKNIASYQEFRENFRNTLVSDNFISRFPSGYPLQAFNGLPFQYIILAPQPGKNTAAQSTFTEELQFQGGSADGRLTWQAGGYVEISDPIGFNSSFSSTFLDCVDPSTLNCTNPLRSGNISDSRTKYSYDGRGGYAQGTYKFTDQLALTAGIRYTWDKVQALGISTRLAPQPNGTFIRTCNDTFRYRTPAGTGIVVTSPEQCPTALEEKSGEPTWLVNLDYKPIDDILIYAKYARGYRAGGLSLTQIGMESWDPERVEAYEIGAKTSFRGGAVNGYFNVAAFYNDFSKQQITVQAITNVIGLGAQNPIVNAGKSRIQGVEVDASVTLFDSFRMDLGYTYLDTKLKSITLPTIPPGVPYAELRPTQTTGGPLAYSPKNRVTLTGTYTLPVPEEVGEISVGATFVHTDKQFVTQNTLPQFQYIPASDILNLNVNWDNAMGQPIDLAFFMTNVTNEVYPFFVSGSYFSAGLETAQYAPPRMWGVRIRYRFGDR